jgi:protocatechuate 3,4-dioxygenase, alpha subunit
LLTGITPSQTIGHYFKYGLTPNGEYAWNDAFGNDLVMAEVTGERIRIEGLVFDGDGQVVADAMLEIWQADGQGRFSDPQDARSLPNAAFRGFGRCGTDQQGGFSFRTIKPGSVPGLGGKPLAPHIVVAVFAKGTTRQAQTVSTSLTRPPPRPTRSWLTCLRIGATRWSPSASLLPRVAYRFDVHLQSDRETVFFDL